MLNIVIFGAPGSGKGTQSERIVEKYAKRRRHATRRPNCLPDWTSRFQFL